MKKSLLLFVVVLLVMSITLNVIAQDSENWICMVCGEKNSGNFCEECGHEHGSWECPDCHIVNTKNFCSMCGKSKSDIVMQEYEGGIVYIGEFENQLRNGWGIMIWPDGYIYKGDWKDNARTGQGKETSQSGSVYEGEWRDSKKMASVPTYLQMVHGMRVNGKIIKWKGMEN